MRRILHYSFLIFIVGFMWGCASLSSTTHFTTIHGTQLLPLGRYDKTGKQLEMISSAVHFSFSFEGKQCSIYVSKPHWLSSQYLQYELDGVYQKRVRIPSDQQLVIIDADSDSTHIVKVYKTTEATTGPLFIDSITGRNATPLKPAEAVLIEFIGNSITCGAAADPSLIGCLTADYHEQHNAYMAYGPRVARALGANFMLSSVSGIGIYRNWNSDGPAIPDVYEKTDFQLQGTRRWNFEQYAPKVVSIALGTNDYSNGDGLHYRAPFDSARFTGNYIRFVQQVKKIYPRAQIALLSSPMLVGERRAILNHCILAVKYHIDQLYKDDTPVAVHLFEPMNARGCTGHPSVEDHAILAEELLPFFRKLIN